MFKKESRYITRGANEKLDLRLQLILWSMIDKLNEEIDTLKFRVDELRQEVMLAEGEPVPFELVSQVMKKFGQVFKESST